MSGIAGALDHVGIVCADLSGAAEAYERLGFTLTPLARHTGRATGNRCVLLNEGYLELIAIVDPAGGSATLSAMLARYAGVHIVALAVADAAAALPRLKRAGLDVPAVVEGGRDAVRFATLPVTDAPEGRLLLIQHLTAEALRPPRFLGHANHAVALREVVIASEAPAEAASRFSRLAGLPVRPDPSGGFVLETPKGRVRMLPPAAVALLFPGAKPPCLPWIAGVVLATDDDNAALRRRLAYWKISHQSRLSEIIVSLFGTFICFRGGAP
jgi:hypothetical protein